MTTSAAVPAELPAPSLARPPLFRGRLPLLKFLRTVRESSIATYSEEAYEVPVMERRLLWRRNLIVSAPEGVKHILLDNAANYQKGPLQRRLLEPGLGQGLITSEGETWRRHRRVMAPAFARPSLLRFAPMMAEAADEMLRRWESLPEGERVDVASAMSRLTLGIIVRAMFSGRNEADLDTVEASSAQYQREVRPRLADFLGLPEWLGAAARARTRVALSGIDGIIDRLIRRDPAESRDDLLTLLLAARDEATGKGLTHQEVRDEVVTIFQAGHETTALALSWTWYLLSQHPAVERRVHEELETVLGGRMPSFEDLGRLTYTRMVLDEAMRLYPPAHTMSRAAIGEDEVAGHRVAPGTMVIISPWVIHRHRLLWERPESFEPERFPPEAAATRHRFAYLPFGGGPRICIGAQFAITEALVILAAVAQRFRLALVPGHPVVPVGLITLKPKHGLLMTLERR
jgi:cytochrome P450